MSFRAQDTLTLAAQVAEQARVLGIETALIGGMALAHHGYARSTEDVDLACYVNAFGEVFNALIERLRETGCEVELHLPDSPAALGGVATIRRGDVGPVQLVSFFNPRAFSRAAVGAGAIERAFALPEETRLRVVTVADLVALKLYAGGPASKQDIYRLLELNPNTTREALEAAAAEAGVLTELHSLLREV